MSARRAARALALEACRLVYERERGTPREGAAAELYAAALIRFGHPQGSA